MSLRGQPPKPTSLKILQGTFRKDRANPEEPTVAPSSLRPPPYLDADAKKHWRVFAKELLDMGVLTTADRTTLARYCELQVLYRTTKKQADYSPKMIGILLKLAIELRTLEIQFGCTPSSRTRVHVVPKDDKPESKLSKYLGKHSA